LSNYKRKTEAEDFKTKDSGSKKNPKIYNCIVDFLIGMSSYQIKLEIIFDGITPNALIPTLSSRQPGEEGAYLDPLYHHRNFGAAELLKAVHILKASNSSHNCSFAPYTATPQIYYLHDNYLGSSICGYPDLLLYVFYNFIIDIDLEKGEFEWVKYKKEHKLNYNRCLAKMFLNNGYITLNGEKHRKITNEKIKQQTTKCNYDEKYLLQNDKHKLILETLENPFIFSLEFEVQALNANRGEHNVVMKPEVYGKKLDKETYFSLFVGKISPKI